MLKTKRIPDLKLPREGDVFLITCPNYWGKGATLTEARKQLRGAGGNVKGRWRVYSAHPETFVNGYGQLAFPSGHNPVMLDEYDPATN